MTVTVDVGGGAVTRRHLDPFGAGRDGSSPSWIDNRAFLNHPATALTGLVHLGARDYDPSLGRFLTADPVLDPASPQQDNGYSYANNDPVTLTDPSGLRRAGDKDDTDAGDWGGITTCPSCSNPTPKFNPSDGWATPTVTVDTRTVMVKVGHKTTSLYDLMHKASGPKNYCGGWSWFCTMVGYNQARNCLANPSVGECLSAVVSIVSDVFIFGTALKATSLLAEAAIQLSRASADSVITVAADEAESMAADEAAGSFADPETFYRTMSKDHFDQMQVNGRVPATGETFISPSAAYSAKYDGQMVEMAVRPGTRDALARIGVSSGADVVRSAYPDMPPVSRGWAATSAFFKGEGDVMNIGLGHGPALDLFNNSILSFRAIPK